MDMTALKTHLETAVGIPFKIGPEIPEMPDVLGVVTAESGGRTINEGLFEVVGFRVQVRGSQNKYADVEAYAKQIDDLIVFGDYPHELWGSWVITAFRSAGGPSPQPLDNGRRIMFPCSYTVHEATDI